MKFFLVSAFVWSVFMSVAQQQVLQWNVFHPVKKEWFAAGTYGSVQEMLIERGELPDPFYGENETKFNWIEKHEWEFSSVFALSGKELSCKFIEIEFPGIDTYAKVYLNDSLLFQAENAFHPYHLQVRDLVHIGENRMRVVFTSPVSYHRQSYDAMATKLPTPNDVGEIGISSMSRKPQYQFGWDWSLRMNTIGFLKPVQIRVYDENRIVQSKVDTKFIEANEATLNLSVSCVLKETRHVNLESRIWGVFKDFEMKDGTLNIPVSMKDPKLWWPRGQGDQHLYSDVWILTDTSGKLIDSTQVTFGIKTSELIQQKDEWGTSFYFNINGRPVFCKGANYIPQDIFPSRISAASISELVDQMQKSNFNMVRVWGGGFYQEETFYDACDKAGIMVWQDMMFACAIYPGDTNFLRNVRNELDYQVPRISAHPSVVLFNGNNEVEVAWKNWGFQLKYKISPKTQKEMEENYVNLFQKLAPEVVALKSTIPYVHTSPLSNWGKDDFYNHGTQHYWGVWHGKDPVEDFGLKSGRFNAEYGFQSFPEYATLNTFSTPEEWDLNSDVMKWHQKSYVGNGMIRKHSDLLYGEAKSFEDFVYYSQLTQARAVGIAIAAHRIGSPRCMGTLYWQLNDCWPAPTWSSIDYYGNWKALQFEAKADFEDIAVLAKTEEIGNEHFYLVSDSPENYETELTYTISGLDGKLLAEKAEKIFVYSGLKQEICLECRTETWMKQNYVIEFSWQNAQGDTLARSFSHVPQKREKAIDSDVSFQLDNIDLINQTAVLKIETSAFLQSLWIYSSVPGVRFDRNFNDLLPGSHEIRITFSQIPKTADFGMKWL